MDMEKIRKALDYIENQPWPSDTKFSIATIMFSDNVVRFTVFPSKETAKEVRKIVGTCRKSIFGDKLILKGNPIPNVRIDIWWPSRCKRVKKETKITEKEVPVETKIEKVEEEVWNWECPKVLLEE